MIDGQQILSNERVITIDDLLIAPVFIASIDEAMTHFEFRSTYSVEAGRALAKTMDQNIFQVALLAARSSALITGSSGGTKLTDSTCKTNADNLIADIAAAMQALDEKNVPAQDRAIFVRPEEYYLLVNSSSKAINRDYNPNGNGSVADGNIFRLFGGEIVKTNHLPSTNVTTGPAAYQGDFSNTAALVMHRSAVGTVKLVDLAIEMDYLVQNQGTLIVAKYAVGHGILRGESAVEIATA